MRRALIHSFTTLGLCMAALGSAQAATLDLRVLIIATGTAELDPGRALMEEMLGQLGVPYDVLDSSVEDLTASRLSSGTHGFYNGIILTDTETRLPGQGGAGFDSGEFGVLHAYERDFGVREAVISGFPATDASRGLDYGMADITGIISPNGRWLPPAGQTEHFEYVNSESVLPIDGFAFSSIPRVEPGLIEVTPLLVDNDNPERALISLIHYPDGREVLLSTVGNAWFFLHSQVLAYEFLSFATRGLFLGAREVYLSVHNDDLFLADEVWNPATNSNWPEDVYSYRAGRHEVINLVTRGAAFRREHPLFAGLRIELAFNGTGASLAVNGRHGKPGTGPQGDELTAAIVQHRSELRFINHTFAALQMDRLCPDLFFTSMCPVTDYTTAYEEIDDNRAVWRALGLPFYDENTTVLLSDSHSGLHDRNGTVEDRSDDIPFPEGANPNFLSAAAALGVKGIASDASYPDQNTIQRISGMDLVLLPRYPTAVFYNVTTPVENTDEYNYIHHERYLEQGLDPCTIPGAVCTPRDYEQILASEAEITVRHMLSYRPYPHYFHQSNLRKYDGQGSSLQFDWLHAVAGLYEQLMDLPVRSPAFHELNTIARTWLSHREVQVQGQLDTGTGQVAIWSQAPGTARVTGVANGTCYGGQYIRTLQVSPTPQMVAVDPALDL